MFVYARCFNRGMSEQVNELLPETVPAPDTPAEGALPAAAPEEAETSVDGAVPEKVETAQKIADEAAEEKTGKGRRGHHGGSPHRGRRGSQIFPDPH